MNPKYLFIVIGFIQTYIILDMGLNIMSGFFTPNTFMILLGSVSIIILLFAVAGRQIHDEV